MKDVQTAWNLALPNKMRRRFKRGIQRVPWTLSVRTCSFGIPKSFDLSQTGFVIIAGTKNSIENQILQKEFSGKCVTLKI